MSEPPRRIIIKKKVAAHDDHHGGAWKVAYADFVTAMMAFFLVMWLISQGPDVKESVAAYFADPIGFNQKAAAGSGMMPGAPSLSVEAPPEEGDVESQLQQKAQEIQRELEKLDDFQEIEKLVVITVGPEGLRIQLQEADDATFFGLGSAKLSDRGTQALQAIAKVIAPLDYGLVLEGHTDSKPYPGKSGYSNWELSADRANAARRTLEESGVAASRLKSIRGYADTRLRFPENPLEPRNRRIEILVLNPALAHPSNPDDN
ncbi:MAG: flagellar motor protein MotB [bacterium]